ncbi:PAS domain-containing protein [Aerophototrophica crusticola]|uniref:histidine kinase n=1 Tax=Aerophototrophica crusticola TaxID=1709002 RepID=A0A858R9Z9_9PROT|nr:PAS domain-containing protein [Rhodospirillaceae bacterium B3]
MNTSPAAPARDAAEGLLQALADASGDALAALVPSGPEGALQVAVANAAARGLVGAVPGLAASALLPGAGALPAALAAVQADGTPRTIEAAHAGRTLRLTVSRAAGALLLRAEPAGERQRLEQELRSARERLELVVRAARDGIWDWDLAAGTIWFSPQWKAHFGYEDHELENTLEAWEKLIFPEDRAIALRMVDDYLAGRVNAFEAIQRFRHRLGGTVLIYTRAMKVLDDQGRPVRLVGAHTDITHIKQAEARLHNAETRLVDAIERLHDGFVLYDKDDRVVLYNSRFLEYYPELADVLCPGITFEQVLRQAVQRGSIKVAPEKVEQWVADRLHNHQNPGPAFERRLGTGRVIRVTEQRTHDGGIVSLGVDVTELRASEERFRSLVSTVPGMVYQWVERADGTRGYSYVSPRCRDMYGVEPEELQRDWWLLPLHPEDVERWEKSIEEAQATLSDWSFEGRFILPDGRPRWWRGVSRPVRVGPGEVRFNGIVIDIEEQKQAEAELKYREAMLRYTAGIAGLGYWVWDRESMRTSYCSPELAAIRGVTVEGYLQTLGSFEQQLQAVYPDDRGTYAAVAIASAKAKRPYGLEYRIVRPDGQVRHIREVGGPVFGERGRLLKYVGALQDITERKQRELELEQARDRLEDQADTMRALARDLEAARDAAEAASRAKSRFLAVMSHELRTPMTGVIGMVDLLLGTPLSTEQRQYLDTLRSSADSLLVVLNDILDFSKIEAGQLALERIPVRLPTLLGDVARLFAPAAAARRLSLDVDLPGSPCPTCWATPPGCAKC